jgi:ABC-2 type transport system permease protein
MTSPAALTPPGAIAASWAITRREIARVHAGARGDAMIAGCLALHALMFHSLALGLRARTCAALLEDAWAIAFVLTTACALLVGMRAFAQERERGTMVTLDALPISSLSLTLGKLVGAAIALLPTQLCALPAALMLAIHAEPSAGQLVTCALGLALAQLAALACALCASAFAATQLGALMLGGASLALLLLTWWLARLAPPPLDALLAASSLYDRHMRAFTQGRVRLQDLVYYLDLTALAATWAALRLGLRRAPRLGAGHVRAAAAALLALGLASGVQALATYNDHVWSPRAATLRPTAPVAALAHALPSPLHATLFLPATSDIEGELRVYLEALVGAQRLQVLDQRVATGEAARLGVEDNGVIALRVEDAAGPRVERIWVGPQRAQRALDSLDAEAERALRRLRLGARTIYVLSGHGELDRRAARDERERAVALWQVWADGTGARVAPLDLARGSAQGIPADAAFVAVLGPRSALQDAERRALDAYLERDGALLLALGPDSPEAARWAALLGWDVGASALCADASFLPTRLALTDRRDLITRSFAVTPALGPLGVPDGGAVVWPQSGWWAERAASPAQAIIFSPPDAWPAPDPCVHEASSADRARRAVGLMLEREGRGRVALLASAQAFSDMAMVRGQGNKLLALALARWLMDPAAPDTAARADAARPVLLSDAQRRGWLWGSAMGLPLAVMAAGMWRRRRR